MAVSQRSVADWISFWYSADFTLFTPSWFRKNPYQDPEEFLARSPVRYVDKIKTPILFVEGEEDWRTPLWQGAPRCSAREGGEEADGHGDVPGREPRALAFSGMPSHRVERLRHIVNWFDKYLQGKAMPVYDLQ